MRIFLLAGDELIVNAFKHTFEDFYFLTDWADANFRIPDFCPDLIVINEDLLDEGKEEELRTLVAQIPIVFLLPEGKLDQRKDQPVLVKPFSFEQLREQLSDISTQIKRQ